MSTLLSSLQIWVEGVDTSSTAFVVVVTSFGARAVQSWLGSGALKISPTQDIFPT